MTLKAKQPYGHYYVISEELEGYTSYILKKCVESKVSSQM